ncbi:MAG: hypothetical protein FH753_02700 [Firmicutes bacterium]|nr:hypothetical protein [Bacillota bacterium]
MGKGKLFIRMDKRIEKNKFGANDFDDHIKYLKNIATKRYFMGGGFTNKIGGMIIYEAKNLKEAKEIADNDPLIKRDLYTYELIEWDLVITSEIEKLVSFIKEK